ncbi:MAG TPA: endonuclease/exonuclease/phosphatase family protein [Devosiaceae bacterium]|nr:endonuclease/exonuclease/phosphatase family protein [Devosiaceae bacterium]
MGIVLGLLRLGVGLAAAGLGAIAVAAWFGFAVPFLDLFNHFQVLLIAGLAMLLVLVLLVFIGSPWRWPLTAILTLGLIASAVTVVPETIAAFAPRPALPTDGRPVLKLITANLFGLNYDMDRTAAVIAKENPDIIALQEYFPEQRGPLDPMIRGKYPYSVHCVGGKRANIAIYSKLPFTQDVDGDCTADWARAGRTSHLLVTFTLANGAKLAVMTTHFEWPVPFDRLQRQQAALTKVISGVSTPLLLVGDFNSAPWSYEQRSFAEAAGLTRQTHGILTWPLLLSVKGWRNTFPVLPLDQAMTKGNVEVHDIHAGPPTGSDHLPLVMTISVGKGPEPVAP